MGFCRVACKSLAILNVVLVLRWWYVFNSAVGLSG